MMYGSQGRMSSCWWMRPNSPSCRLPPTVTSDRRFPLDLLDFSLFLIRLFHSSVVHRRLFISQWLLINLIIIK